MFPVTFGEHPNRACITLLIASLELSISEINTPSTGMPHIFKAKKSLLNPLQSLPRPDSNEDPKMIQKNPDTKKHIIKINAKTTQFIQGSYRLPRFMLQGSNVNSGWKVQEFREETFCHFKCFLLVRLLFSLNLFILLRWSLLFSSFLLSLFILFLLGFLFSWWWWSRWFLSRLPGRLWDWDGRFPLSLRKLCLIIAKIQLIHGWDK